MKETITSREDIFLAKIAGKDVDIKTMTPPVAASMREKLMLDIADRIDSIEAGSGGGGTYEKIIGTIGSSEKDGDLYFGNFVIEGAPDIKVNSEVKLNGLSLAPIPDAGAKPSFYLNLDLDTFVPTGTPAYFVEIENATVTIGSDTDIGGKTMTLEYKNSSGGGGSDITFITATVDPVTNEISNASMTLDECLAAYAEGKRLGFRLTSEIDGIGTARAELPSAAISRYVVDGAVQGGATFSTMSLTDGHPEALIVSAVTGDADGAWVFRTESIGNNLKVIHGELTPKEGGGGEQFDLEIKDEKSDVLEIIKSESVAILDATVNNGENQAPNVFVLMTSKTSMDEGSVMDGHAVLSAQSRRLIIAKIVISAAEAEGPDDLGAIVTTYSYGMPDVPDYSAADAGKVLSVDSEGKLAWVTPT